MTTTNEGSGTVSAQAVTPEFRVLCEKYGVKPTRRQASKYRNGYGALAAQDGTTTRKVNGLKIGGAS